MKVKIKRLSKKAIIPSYAKQGDAGMDLTVTSIDVIDVDLVRYGFGLSFEIPKGYVGLVFPRSSIYKKEQILTNSVGVIDSGYRGEVMAVMVYTDKLYKIGERAAQIIIIPYPNIEFIEVNKLSSSIRGEGGFGSTDNK